MSILGNIVWLLFGGLLTGLGYILGGLITCLTIVGIPFGLQSIRLGVATLTPFGKEVIPSPHGQGCLGTGFDILWLLLFGWEIALAHVIWGALLCVTVIGIPFGLQHFKLVPVALLPFGRELVARPKVPIERT